MKISCSKKIFLVLFLFFVTTFTYAEKTELKGLFSLECEYLNIGLENNGWGLGCSYERLIFDWLSWKAKFGHSTFQTIEDNVNCTSVTVSLSMSYYPFSSGLNWLYVSAGCSTDFLNYFGSGNIPDPANDTIIKQMSLVGWKQNFKLFDIKENSLYCMLDFSTGWQFIFSNSENFIENQQYVEHGFILSTKIKFSLGNNRSIFKEVIKTIRKSDK